MNSPAGIRQGLYGRLLKRGLDLIVSSLGLVLTGWLIVVAYVGASIDTRQSGLFTQIRVGRDGRLFRIMKIRTMRSTPAIDTTVTHAHDPRITPFGRLLRRSKIDELPQLINVFLGDMSLVGPRPDVPGFVDLLSGEDRTILSVRPGITGPATLRFRHEEELLAAQDDPETYNREVIFPEKVRINREYVEHLSLGSDLRHLVRTVFNR